MRRLSSSARIWRMRITGLVRRTFVQVTKSARSSTFRFISSCAQSTSPKLTSRERTFDSLFIPRKMRRLRNNDRTS